MLFQKALKALDEDGDVLAAPQCPEATRGQSCGCPSSPRTIQPVPSSDSQLFSHMSSKPENN